MKKQLQNFYDAVRWLEESTTDGWYESKTQVIFLRSVMSAQKELLQEKSLLSLQARIFYKMGYSEYRNYIKSFNKLITILKGRQRYYENKKVQ